MLEQLSVKERECGAVLIEISNDFYQKLHVEMRKINNEQQLERISYLLHDFIRMRHSKIIQFASVMNLNHSIIEKLSTEEIKFYEEIQKSSTNFKDSVLTGNVNYD